MHSLPLCWKVVEMSGIKRIKITPPLQKNKNHVKKLSVDIWKNTIKHPVRMATCGPGAPEVQRASISSCLVPGLTRTDCRYKKKVSVSRLRLRSKTNTTSILFSAVLQAEVFPTRTVSEE